MDADNPLYFATAREWRDWLQHNHDKEKEVWLVHYKKGKGKAGLSYLDALEEALCYGWIDGKLRRIDDEKFMLRYSPRKPNSVWSLGNKEKAKALIAAGRMAPPGFASIEAAKKSGRWQAAYTDRSEEKMPDDLKDALAQNGAAFNNFQCLAISHKNAYIRWVNETKMEETRKKRIMEVVKRVEA
ncbi:MAG: YdeI/OmpD-associated family protein, partial [Dehalococcoidia bacterium]|nr:YdeI/OmpD-associated family protein [Dehalococcoidia bacterium]